MCPGPGSPFSPGLFCPHKTMTTQLVNAELIELKNKLESAANFAVSLPYSANLGLVRQSLEAAYFWLDREINPPKKDPPKESA